MALASTADNFGQFTNDPNENVKKAAAATTAASSSTSTNQLNFYESMYHFRKMFPNVDSDVIECVLRSNSGAIDKTIDHLLTMNHHQQNDEETKPINNNNLNQLDMPPSYTEFMSSKVLTESSNVATVVDLNVDSNTSEKKFQVLVQDDSRSTLINVTNEKQIQKLTESNEIAQRYLNKLNNPNRLTGEQIWKLFKGDGSGSEISIDFINEFCRKKEISLDIEGFDRIFLANNEKALKNMKNIRKDNTVFIELSSKLKQLFVQPTQQTAFKYDFELDTNKNESFLKNKTT